MIRTPAGTYEVIEENRDGWNPEAFKERYSDILDKYDYIVGDWGYGQLRLRGFYDNANRKVPFEQRIATLDEYLQEYCNFGCPYFVLKKVKAAQTVPGESPADYEESSITLDLQASSRAEQAIPYLDRKERRRFHQRPNRQDRPEKQGSSQGDRQNRHERAGKTGLAEQGKTDKNWRADRGGKDRRGNSLRSNRDKVSVSNVPPQNKPD
ncbi:YutD family protein [Brevibacillus sp. H7]|uniref:YutD family protein n=1 Tax=Brevibacillus sp. H7 TaxID=3349138 RepID=UPI0038172945